MRTFNLWMTALMVSGLAGFQALASGHGGRTDDGLRRRPLSLSDAKRKLEEAY